MWCLSDSILTHLRCCLFGGNTQGLRPGLHSCAASRAHARASFKFKSNPTPVCRKGAPDKGGAPSFILYAFIPTARATHGTKLAPPLRVAMTSVAAMEVRLSSTSREVVGEGRTTKPVPALREVAWVANTTTYDTSPAWAKFRTRP